MPVNLMAMDAREPKPTIAVLMPTDKQWCRQLLVGISRYAHTYGPWRFHCNVVPAHRHRLPRDWRGQGVIAWVGTPRIHANIQHVSAPIVNVAAARAYHCALPRVALDYEQIGRLAAQHLITCGLRHFGYCSSRVGSELHQGFVGALEEGGLSDRLISFSPPELSPQKPGRWVDHERRLLDWIRTLPTPVGVVTPHCLIGQALIQVCQAHGFRVPEDVAVLQLADDATLCEMCHPPLSAIDLGGERHGYEAAALLDRLMHGEPPSTEPVFVPPAGVVPRRSTDVLAIKDAEISRAVRFIREHIRDPITVADVLRVVPVARRSLERRFKQLVGHSPAEEIRRLRVRRAQDLLTSTAMPMPDVAAAAGFASAEYMARVFRQRLGVSPYAYRMRTHQPGRATNC